jgi:hypothetical protein
VSTLAAAGGGDPRFAHPSGIFADGWGCMGKHPQRAGRYTILRSTKKLLLQQAFEEIA